MGSERRWSAGFPGASSKIALAHDARDPAEGIRNEILALAVRKRRHGADDAAKPLGAMNMDDKLAGRKGVSHGSTYRACENRSPP
jgi:hypothetical protein